MTKEELPNEASRKDKMREALAHYEELATKACWHRSDIPDAIRAYYAPLPPAEGAEPILLKHCKENKVFLTSNEFHTILDAMREFAAQQQPTAEGAEEIFNKYQADAPMKTRFINFNEAIKAMQEFATLHAQQMAKKMVREELIAYDKYASRWIDNYRAETAEDCVDEYLKSKEQ